MKKFVLSVIVLVSLVSVSACRQDDDFSAEEQARIDLLKNATTDNTLENVLISEREPIKPPRK